MHDAHWPNNADAPWHSLAFQPSLSNAGIYPESRPDVLQVAWCCMSSIAFFNIWKIWKRWCMSVWCCAFRWQRCQRCQRSAISGAKVQWRLLALSRGLGLPMPRPFRAPYFPGLTVCTMAWWPDPSWVQRKVPQLRTNTLTHWYHNYLLVLLYIYNYYQLNKLRIIIHMLTYMYINKLNFGSITRVSFLAIKSRCQRFRKTCGDIVTRDGTWSRQIEAFHTTENPSWC